VVDQIPLDQGKPFPYQWLRVWGLCQLPNRGPNSSFFDAVFRNSRKNDSFFGSSPQMSSFLVSQRRSPAESYIEVRIRPSIVRWNSW
jgi:hypothetical protein